MTSSPQYVFAFGPGISEGDPARADLLGGKGASLAAMSRAGFPVPPGFTISSECCAYAETHGGRWPDGLETQVRAAVARLEESTGRTFGRGPRPLLVAVRSGAGVSMPGMMDTILNCGLSLECGAAAPLSHPIVSESSASPSISPAESFWKDYAEHIRMFAASVAGLKLKATKVAGTLRVPPAGEGQAAVVGTGEKKEWEGRKESDADTTHSKGSMPPAETLSRVDPTSALSVSNATPPAPPSEGGEPDAGVEARDWKVVALSWLAEYERHTGRPFPTDPWDALSQCINAVFASWNSDRARAYRQHHGIRGLPGTAVNVQMMFPSERSGVLFTMNPQNPDVGEMILEASWGLGEAVVSGSVTPDIYVIDRVQLALRSVVPGDRPHDAPALIDDEVRQLAELGQRVERHFNVPSDIEWGIADGRIALLQTRAIRGLDALRAAENLRRSEIARLKDIAGSRHVVWVIHNLAETLPHPTPLTWDIVRWFMSGDGGFGRMYRRLGFSPSREVCERGFLEPICGRIYVDPIRAAGLFWGTLPFEYDAGAILADRQTLERPPTKMNFEAADPFLFAKLPGLLWQMFRSSRAMKRMRARSGTLECGALSPLCPGDRASDAEEESRTSSPDLRSKSASVDGSLQSGDKAPHSKVPARDRFELVARPSLEAFLRETAERPVSSLTTNNLLAELDRRIQFVLGDFAAESLLPGFFGGIAREELQRWLVQILGPERGEELTSRLTTGLAGDVTVEQNVELHDAAQNSDGLRQFLDRFGHRSAEEMELAQPRWSEDATFLERMLGSFRATGSVSPAARHAEQVAARRRAEVELPRLLEEHGASSLRENIETVLVEAQSLLPYREIGKYQLMRGYAAIRAVLVELSNRWSLGRDIFFLHRNELPQFESKSAELREEIARRKDEWQAGKKLVMSDVVDSERLDELGRPPRRDPAAKGHHAARPIAPGIARGPARIVRSPSEAEGLGVGYILVCPSTDPGWTPLFLNCKGLVVERGGVLSHGAIVARDFGIPAVVLEGATQLLEDGAMIEVDAHQGAIQCVEEKSAT